MQQMPNICDGWKATMTLLESIGILFKHKFKTVKTNSMMNCYTEEELYWMTGGNTGTLPVRITPSKINVLGENEICKDTKIKSEMQAFCRFSLFCSTFRPFSESKSRGPHLMVLRPPYISPPLCPSRRDPSFWGEQIREPSPDPFNVAVLRKVFRYDCCLYPRRVCLFLKEIFVVRHCSLFILVHLSYRTPSTHDPNHKA